MSKYFDKDFFKFFTGFVAIVLVSLTIILITRIYEQKLTSRDTNTASVIETIVP
jgi:hypothetical protein